MGSNRIFITSRLEQVQCHMIILWVNIYTRVIITGVELLVSHIQLDWHQLDKARCKFREKNRQLTVAGSQEDFDGAMI